MSRSSGLLLHVTSLPSPYGVGDVGDGAARFVDALAAAGQRVWQVLPLVPPGDGDSPYASPSTFALSPLLISPERLRDDGLLTDADLAAPPSLPDDRVDFAAARQYKEALLASAYERFQDGAGGAALRGAFEDYAEREAAWLEDYALFVAIKADQGGAAWTEWPAALAHRDERALAEARRQHAEAVDRERFDQFVAERQWAALRERCRAAGVEVLGDLPIYVALDSADVWADRDLFDLDEAGRPREVAGVPPDYFSATGQRWGNPLYRWDRMAENGYRWWRRRLRRTLALVDRVRLDHFRAFEAYWAIPASEETAVEGRWVEGPGSALLDALEADAGRPLPIVAEDLGLITDGVRDLIARHELPGMAVLQFAFGGDAQNAYLPHNHRRRQVVYTGTHDNDTTAGWWAAAPPEVRAHVERYLGPSAESVPRRLVRAAWASVADLAVVPVQDMLGLGSDARMNTPGEAAGNWAWRLTSDQLDALPTEWLRNLTETTGRGEGDE
ncbi:4-alpha-glucanotransferase [Rubrivirga sp. S365]